MPAEITVDFKRPAGSAQYQHKVPVFLFFYHPLPLSCITSCDHVTQYWTMQVAVGRGSATHQSFLGSSLPARQGPKGCLSCSCYFSKWKREKWQITYAWSITVNCWVSFHCWWLTASIKLTRYFPVQPDVCCVHHLLLHSWSFKLSHHFLISWQTVTPDPLKS